MMGTYRETAVLRFAPSPNGALHLGHAYSALLNEKIAAQLGGRLLLRIEDIDTARCTPALEAAMIADLDWLGVGFEQPYRRQSQHFDEYRTALDRLIAGGFAYPAFMSRGELRAAIERFEAESGASWPRDPDGAPLYPPGDRERCETERKALMGAGHPFAWRLDMARALEAVGDDITWTESGRGPAGETGRIAADASAWGDVILARRDTPTSYHLSVVVDDALQGVTHVVRGRDLFHATAVHRVMQWLLGLPAPEYHHHDLILAGDGTKLSKSKGDTGIAALRDAGVTAGDIRHRLGFG